MSLLCIGALGSHHCVNSLKNRMLSFIYEGMMASYLLGKQLFHDGHSGMSRAGDPGQLLEAKHSPPPGSESLANHVLCRSAVTAGYFEKVFPLNLPHWLLFSSVLPCHYFPYIFSSLLNRDIIETGVERSLGLRNKLFDFWTYLVNSVHLLQTEQNV